MNRRLMKTAAVILTAAPLAACGTGRAPQHEPASRIVSIRGEPAKGALKMSAIVGRSSSVKSYAFIRDDASVRFVTSRLSPAKQLELDIDANAEIEASVDMSTKTVEVKVKYADGDEERASVKLNGNFEKAERGIVAPLENHRTGELYLYVFPVTKTGELVVDDDGIIPAHRIELAAETTTISLSWTELPITDEPTTDVRRIGSVRVTDREVNIPAER